MTKRRFFEIATGRRDADIRAGQHAFSVLGVANAPLAERLRGSDLDPFYDDSKLASFLLAVDREWKE